METIYNKNRVVPLKNRMPWFNNLGFQRRVALKLKYFGTSYLYVNMLQVMTIYKLEYPNRK